MIVDALGPEMVGSDKTDESDETMKLLKDNVRWIEQIVPFII